MSRRPKLAGWRFGFVSVTLLLLSYAPSWAQFTLQGPGVDPADFEITTFADGLDYPVGMASLSDGSMLVAVSNGSTWWGSSSGRILRLADTDGDGVADSETTLVSNVPGGGLSALRVAGDLVFTTGQGGSKPISIYRMGATPTSPLSLVGSINTGEPTSGWLHPHSALEVRGTPGMPGSYDLLFQLGSRTNFDDTTGTVGLTSNIGVSGNIRGDAIHMIRITDNGNSISGSNLTQLATGLRNAAGMAFQPGTGDLYLQDNGIDGLSDPNEPHSADELNLIPAADVGGGVEDFGFPSTYTAYRTNNVVGNTGIQPLVAFQPIDGEEAEGPNDIAFAPAGFPAGLNNGVFVGMHGKFVLGGVANEENPLVFVDLTDNSYFHFISNDEPGVGHLDGLLTTPDALFVSDLSPGGGLGGGTRGTGKIYKIRAIQSPVTGDFNGDSVYDCADIDALVAEIAAGTDTASFDLTGDGSVNLDDQVAWLAAAGAANLASGNPYLPGDANLDGFVDVSDLNIWSANKFQTASAWCLGNFNGDAVVDVSDLNIWSANKFQTSDAQVVPEPAGICMMWLFACLVAGRRTGRCAE